jgi:uncharacterized protein (TIGR02147 family)
MEHQVEKLLFTSSRREASEKLSAPQDASQGAVETAPASTAPVSTTIEMPDLYSCLDYREYLAQWFAARKKIQSGYSGALFAKKARISSHTLLGMVIRGERNLSTETIRGFIRALGLKSKEALYFEKLVLFNQSKDSEDRAYYFDQLHALSQSHGRELITRIKNHASYLSHWYVVAIREMTALEGFRPDGEWISRKLKKKITKKQAEEAWALLLELGLVKEIAQSDGSKHYEAVDPKMDIDPGTVDFAIRNYHKEYLERAKDAVDGETLEERELSSLTLAVSEEDLPLLREKIKEFRKKLNTEFPTGTAPKKKVVAVNLQALVLTE